MIKSRDYQFDNLKTLLIFLVVVGHFIQIFIDDSAVLRTLYLFIYSFHMPLFVFVSGYFSKNVEKVRDRAFVDIFVLYLIFNSLYYITYYFLGLSAGFNILNPGWTLWYLLSLFTWRILLKDLIKIRYILPLSILLSIVIGITDLAHFLSLARTVAFLPFFLIGYYTTEDHIKKIQKINILVPIVLIPLIIFLCSFVPDSFDIRILSFSWPFESLGLDRLVAISQRVFLFVLTIITSVLIIRLMPKRNMYLTQIGYSTLMIYLLHPYLVRIFQKVVFMLGSSVNDVILLIIPFIIVAILSIPLVKKIFNFVVDKIKFILLKS